MENKAVIEKIRTLKAVTEEILAGPDVEPFMRSCIDCAHSHIMLAYNELGLDVE